MRMRAACILAFMLCISLAGGCASRQVVTPPVRFSVPPASDGMDGASLPVRIPLRVKLVLDNSFAAKERLQSESRTSLLFVGLSRETKTAEYRKILELYYRNMLEGMFQSVSLGLLDPTPADLLITVSAVEAEARGGHLLFLLIVPVPLQIETGEYANTLLLSDARGGRLAEVRDARSFGGLQDLRGVDPAAFARTREALELAIMERLTAADEAYVPYLASRAAGGEGKVRAAALAKLDAIRAGGLRPGSESFMRQDVRHPRPDEFRERMVEVLVAAGFSRPEAAHALYPAFMDKRRASPVLKRDFLDYVRGNPTLVNEASRREAVRLAADQDQSMRAAAVAALRALDAQGGLLREYLASKDESLRVAAVYGLAGYGRDAAWSLPLLARLFRDEAEPVRMGIVDAARPLATRQMDALAVYIMALGDVSARVNEHAARAIGAMGRVAAPAADVLANGLTTDRWGRDVRLSVISALTGIEAATPAVARVVEHLAANDSDAQVREEAGKLSRKLRLVTLAEQPAPVFALAQEASPRAAMPRIWLFTLGVSRFKAQGMDLRFAARDAKAFHEIMSAMIPAADRQRQAVLLTDGQATRGAALTSLTGLLRQTAPGDVAIVYIATHGLPDPDTGELNFVAHDTDLNNLLATGLSHTDIDRGLKLARAGKVLFVVDTCHSGFLGGPQISQRGIRIVESNALLRRLAEAKDGVAILSASSAAEMSQESETHGGGHGVFTYYLIDGLKGAADRDRDGIVTLREAYDHVYQNVSRDTAGRQHPELKGVYDNGLPLMSLTGR